MKNASFLIFIAAMPFQASKSNIPEQKMPNILFIAVDDLRPELGCYGKADIRSPNIDRLAKTGIVFKNAFCNFPVSGPSRASLLSGIYPSQSRFIKWNCSQDEELPGIVSLPMHFKNNNYRTVSLGKIYNNFGDAMGSWDYEWRPPATTTQFWDYQSAESIRIHEERSIDWINNTSVRNFENLPHTRGPAFEHPDVPDNAYMDGKIAGKAIDELQNLKNSSQPFFLAVGFHKPHLPFNAPGRYWDMYDHHKIKLPLNNQFSKDAPDAAISYWSELRGYSGIPQKGPLVDSTALNLIHGYYACISYVDAQIGLVLNALEDLGLSENTIVILWGDHGWFLGEHGFWCKNSNFKKALQSPLIIRVPGKKADIRTEALVDFLDIYPTLCDFAGLSKPVHLQGKSFAALIDDPEQPWKEEIFCRCSGETILTKTHAYTEWLSYETMQPHARMLYDHRSDPEENINISEKSENKELIKKLHDKLINHIKRRDKILDPY